MPERTPRPSPPGDVPAPLVLAYRAPVDEPGAPSLAQILRGVVSIIVSLVLAAVALWWVVLLVAEWGVIWWVAPLILLGIAGIASMAWSLVEEAVKRLGRN